VVDVQREASGRFKVEVDGRPLHLEARLYAPSTLHISTGDVSTVARVVRVSGEFHVAIGGETYRLVPESAAPAATAAALASPQIVAPMPGKVLQVLVKEGQKVEAGDDLLTLEAMKMENRMTAEARGVVRKIHVTEGQTVDGGAVLVEMDYTQPG
jgi:biotin carboxyl carrier protein